MLTLNRGWIIPVLTLMWACDGGTNSVTSPSPSPSHAPTSSAVPTLAPDPTPSKSVSLTGQVTDRTTSQLIPGAKVVVSYPPPMPSATTDNAGRYSLAGLPDGGGLVWAVADNYEADLQYHRFATQNFRLYPVKRMVPGDSTVVTVPYSNEGTAELSVFMPT